MAGRRDGSELVQRVARDALRLLRAHGHVSLQTIASKSGVSPETAKRSLNWLREEGASLTYDAAMRSWCLAGPFALPLLDPTPDDLQAALTTAGLMDALGEERIADRAWAIFRELEARLTPAAGRAPRRDALRVTQTATDLSDVQITSRLLRAVRKQVVGFRYRSPWTKQSVEHVSEPWQVGLFDGALYLRAFSRTKGAPRTFNLAGISRLAVLDGERPTAPVPDEELWGNADPSLGVDVDRPGTAVLRFRGPVARWLAGVRWHRGQTDQWLEPDEVLVRTVPFRSCREFARRLAGVSDGLDEVRPAELAEELWGLLERARARLAHSASVAPTG